MATVKVIVTKSWKPGDMPPVGKIAYMTEDKAKEMYEKGFVTMHDVEVEIKDITKELPSVKEDKPKTKKTKKTKALQEPKAED